MAERQNPADRNADRREAMYREEPKGGGKKQKVEEKATKEAGGKSGTADKDGKETKAGAHDTHARHAREREDMHERHTKEREDMHKRHAGEHAETDKRQDEEIAQAMAAGSSPNSAGPQEAADSAAGANTPVGNVAA